MMVMSGSQYIISPYEPNGFFNGDSLFEREWNGLGLYALDNVCSLTMSFSYIDYQDPIELWLDNSFIERYSWYSFRHIIQYMGGFFEDLIFPNIFCFILPSCFLTFESYIFAKFESREWLLWKYDYMWHLCV